MSKVAVIGGGIVGLITAVEIQRTGRAVVVIDPGPPGGRQAASYGNAGWIYPGSIFPVSLPGLWRKVPGMLMDASGPLVIRWAYLPSLSPWLLRFIWAGRNWEVVEACARLRFELGRDSSAYHKTIAAEAGAGDLIVDKGLIIVYHDKSEFLGEARISEVVRSLGFNLVELDEDSLRQLEPNLADEYRFGVLRQGSCHVADLQAYCDALANLIRKRGGEFVSSQATGFEMSGGRLKSVKTGTGAVECAQAVVAAGIGSKRLAAAAGDRIPLESERGYHVVIADEGKTIAHAIMPADGKMGITPMRGGLRLAGQVELASVDAAPDWGRADVLQGWARRVFRQPFNPNDVIDRWMGHRPSTPDGLPCIGPAKSCGDIFYAFGHGHTGLTHAPGTAKVIAALVAGEKPEFDVSPMSARRF